MPTFLPYLLGFIGILIGLRTIITQEATVSIQLWGRGRNAPPSEDGGGYSTSHHTGFIAILIGIAEIVTAISIMVKGQ
jgi:hypothetical protein